MTIKCDLCDNDAMFHVELIGVSYICGGNSDGLWDCLISLAQDNLLGDEITNEEHKEHDEEEEYRCPACQSKDFTFNRTEKTMDDDPLYHSNEIWHCSACGEFTVYDLDGEVIL